MDVLVRAKEEHCYSAGGWPSRSTQVISGKEVMSMPITLTFHVLGIFTITVRIVKSNNRHSAK